MQALTGARSSNARARGSTLGRSHAGTDTAVNAKRIAALYESLEAPACGRISRIAHKLALEHNAQSRVHAPSGAGYALGNADGADGWDWSGADREASDVVDAADEPGAAQAADHADEARRNQEVQMLPGAHARQVSVFLAPMINWPRDS
jgi:hypothetical protein